MNVLLDESVPRQLAPLLTGHLVATVASHGWAGLKNGELLRRANQEFEVFITGDKNLEFQQNLSNLDLRVIVIDAPNNRVETILELVPSILAVLETVQPGTATKVAT